jgi:hypothetical protein
MEPRKKFEGLHSELTGKILGAFFQVHIEVGLLLNFGRQSEFRRKIYDNPRKGSLAWIKNP